MKVTAEQMKAFISQNPPIKKEQPRKHITSVQYKEQSQRLDLAAYADKYGRKNIKTKTK